MIVQRAEPTGSGIGSNWEPGILNGHGGKPKGMHWRTYERLTSNMTHSSKFHWPACPTVGR